MSYFSGTSSIAGSSNLTWDNTNRRFFIGPATSISDADAFNLSSNSGGVFRHRVTGSSVPVYFFLQNGGTIAAPTTSADNANLGSLRAAGYSTGGDFVTAAQIDFFLDGAIGGAGGAAGKIDIATGSALGPPSTKLLIDSTATTAQSFAYLGANRALRTTAAPTDGQVLIGDTGADPVAATITAGSGISVTNGAGSITIAATGGGGTAPIIYPSSAVPATSGMVFDNIHVSAGSGAKYFRGFGIANATTLASDAIWALQYDMPPALPAGTATQVTRCIANLTSGALKLNVKWASCSTEEDCSGLTLQAEGTQTITWAAGDNDQFKEITTVMDADTIVAGEILVENFTVEDTDTTVADTVTCKIYLTFVP